MSAFLAGALCSLIPSVLGVAWLVWRAGGLSASDAHGVQDPRFGEESSASSVIRS